MLYNMYIRSKMAKQDKTLAKAQEVASDRAYQVITLLTIGVILVGIVFYHYVENFTWVDAFYFSVVTLATVGYGDITPKTEIGKIFTVFYILFGIGIIVAFTSNLLKRAQRHRFRRYKK